MIDIINWDVIKKRIETESWATKLYSDTIEALDSFIENYHDDASRVTGWFHHYNCEKCQGRLKFDVNSPELHICSVCGLENTGQTINNVWYDMYRSRANGAIYNSAVAYNITGDEKYIIYIRKVLDFYADNYDDFVSDPIAKRFEGKLQNQHLGDAGSMMTILLGLDMVRNQFTDIQLKHYYEK